MSTRTPKMLDGSGAGSILISLTQDRKVGDLRDPLVLAPLFSQVVGSCTFQRMPSPISRLTWRCTWTPGRSCLLKGPNGDSVTTRTLQRHWDKARKAIGRPDLR